MSWLDDELKRERAAEQRADHDAKIQLHRVDVIRAKGRDLLDALTGAVEKIVLDYGAKTADEPRRKVQFTRNPAGGFSLHKPNYPATSLECGFDREAMVIRVRRTHTPDGQSMTLEQNTALGIAVNDRDELSIYVDGKPWTLLEAAETLLMPVLFPRV